MPWSIWSISFDISLGKYRYKGDLIMSFEEFLSIVYGITYLDYCQLNEYQKKAIDIDWRDRKYGKGN